MAKRRPAKKSTRSSKKSATNSRKPAASKSKRSASTSRNNAKHKGEVFDDEITDDIMGVPLRLAAQKRYLNYSLSVITSRALPDVRDGLKPVQRRILYTMNQQNLTYTAKFRKSATVVGQVMGNYHPHGDASIYDAMVRLAQPFAMRMRLVDGNGNFGSIDADNAAAMRYTECRMTRISTEMLADLATRTVAFKDNYDGRFQEPVVLPSRVPNLLVNGVTGIAVGMATNIPPHNLKEVCNALLKLLKDPEIKDYQLVANDAVHGPDFPTGGQVINTKEELRDIYRTGSGAIKLRGTAKVVKRPKGTRVLRIDSIPYNVVKATLVERISELVYSSKLPLVTEVKDLSTSKELQLGKSIEVHDDICIDLTLKKDADENKVLAYLYKHTPLQSNFNVNLTCLVPTENPEVGRPERLGLKEILWHFLHFRLEVVTKRLENELEALEKRLHILRGFVTVFDALDIIIRIIRKSDGKADAAEKIMRRFPVGKGKDGLDAEQTDAILELKLYRLARLEINLILDELKDKEKRARAIRRLLKEDADSANTNQAGRWKIVRNEIESLVGEFCKDTASKRRTKITSDVDDAEYTAEDFIVAEDCHVLVTKDGWVKRQRQIADPAKSRTRQGDSVLACVAGSTRATIGFFSSMGVCYTTRLADIPASTGFGEPIQKLFKLKDGEKIVSVMSFDPRVIGDISDPKDEDYCPEVHGFAASSNGYALRFGLSGLAEPSTRSGRRYARASAGASIIGAFPVDGNETILAISEHCRAMICPAEDINYLSGAGKGVMLIKLAKDDRLVGFKPSASDRDLLLVETNRGAQKTISTAKYKVTGRGGRGNEVQKNGKIAKIVTPPVESPEPLEGTTT